MTPAEYRTSQSEAAFMRDVIAFAEARGWRVWHDNDSRRNRAGWPDLILVRVDAAGVGHLLAWELKTESKRRQPTPKQREWIDALSRVRVIEAAVLRPSNWDDMIRRLT